MAGPLTVAVRHMVSSKLNVPYDMLDIKVRDKIDGGREMAVAIGRNPEDVFFHDKVDALLMLGFNKDGSIWLTEGESYRHLKEIHAPQKRMLETLTSGTDADHPLHPLQKHIDVLLNAENAVRACIARIEDYYAHLREQGIDVYALLRRFAPHA